MKYTSAKIDKTTIDDKVEKNIGEESHKKAERRMSSRNSERTIPGSKTKIECNEKYNNSKISCDYLIENREE